MSRIRDAIGPEKFDAVLRQAARRRRRKRAGGHHEGKASARRFAKSRDDPVAFARDVLHVQPWPTQAELLQAASDHDRMLCRSGHKCGKSIACVESV